jgi:hypothetical protein
VPAKTSLCTLEKVTFDLDLGYLLRLEKLTLFLYFVCPEPLFFNENSHFIVQDYQSLSFYSQLFRCIDPFQARYPQFIHLLLLIAIQFFPINC